MEDKPQIDPKHLAYYILAWITCVDDQCGMHKMLKEKNNRYSKRTNWDLNEKRFRNASFMHK